jgi:hypothetical protein
MSEESRKAIFEHHLLMFKNNGVKGTNLLGLTDAKLATMGVASLSERDDIMAQVDSLKGMQYCAHWPLLQSSVLLHTTNSESPTVKLRRCAKGIELHKRLLMCFVVAC